MGYMLPLKFIRVSDQMSICATRIVAIMSTHAYQARRLIKEEKQADTLLNAAGRDKVRSAIILDNGAVVASPFSISRILSNIQRADGKNSQAKRITLSHGLKLYDVIPDEVDKAEQEDYPEIDAIDEEQKDEDIELEGEEEEDLSDILDIAWDGVGDEE